MKTLIAAVCSGLVLTVAGAALAEPVASVVALRGKATVERAGKRLDAQPKLGIELQDTVATAEGGRVKLLFIDDSVLTLAEKSRMSVDTFIHSRSDRGSSLFNLLDGKMRAVVGKTRFEVKTPTVVAAARGTLILFDTGILNGQSFTRITCLEGIVDVRSLTAAPGTPPVLLSPGQSMVVMAGQPMPVPTQLTPAELEKLKRDTSTSGAEIKLPDVASGGAIIGTVSVTPIPVAPPFDRQQPAKQPSSVTIGVKF
jgi:ferric-dicitrate binding protein FerR (iron transport regulator)